MTATSTRVTATDISRDARRSRLGDVVTIVYTGTIDATSLTGVAGKRFDATEDHAE